MKYITQFLLLFIVSVSFGQISEPQLILEGTLSHQNSVFSHINQDSIIDICYIRGGVTSRTEGGIYQGYGYMEEGELRWHSELIAQKTPQDLFLFDVDKDGTEELIAAYGDGNIPCNEVYEKVNDLYILSTKGAQFFDTICLLSPAVLDLNQDGYQDIFAGTGSLIGNSEYSMFIQKEEEMAQFDQKIITDDGRFFGLGDFDQDNTIDFLMSNQSEYELRLHTYNKQNATFNDAIVVDTNYRSSRINLSYIGDIDYDGDIELFYRNPLTDTLYRLDTFYHASMSIAEPVMPLDFGSQWWMDMNFDGFVDLIYPHDGVGFFNDGHGNFTPETVSYSFPASELMYQYYDLEKDSALFLFKNLGGMFASHSQWDDFYYHFSEYQVGSVDDAELQDIDMDGIQDLVVASRWSHKFLWFKRKSNNTFGEAQILIPEEGAYDIAFADLNGDSITDIMFSAIWSDKLSVKYGLGDGHFSDRDVLVDESYLLRGSDIGDFDLDNYPDIVYSVLTEGKTYLIRNQEGVFSAPEVLTDNFDPESIIVRDITGDGYPDILVMGYYGFANYKLLVNDQNGGFVDYQTGIPAWSRNIKWTDFDGDGIDEVVHSSSSLILISKIINGQLSNWLSIPMEEFSFNDYFVLDYNGDGYMDIITGRSFGGDSHQLYLNQNNELFIYDDEFNNLFNYTLPNISSDEHVNLDVDQDGDIDLLYSDGFNLLLIEDQRFDPSFTGATFWDLDEDSIYTEATDILLSGVKVEAESEFKKLQAFSDRYGYYRFFLDTINYDVTGFPLNDCWIPIEENAISVIGNRDSTTTHQIGFWSTQNEGEDVDIFRSTTPMRCLFPVKHWVTIKNNSCTSFNGPFTYQIDQKLSEIRLISLDDHTLEGNIIRVENLDLQPGEEIKFHFTATGPSVDFINEQVYDTLTLKYIDPIGGVDTLELKQTFTETIRCAYDPNDKLVFPDRRAEYGDAYVTNENLHYTIRFQNTGNDTAFNIYLLDTLEEKLDISTFRPVDASHEHEISLDPISRILRIDFRNILLPDSTINLIGSNGFFSFKIKPIDGLEDFEIIENSAGIYFDFNPPIITNTTKITFVEDLSTLLNTEEPQFEEGDRFQVWPNPTHDWLYYQGESIQKLAVVDMLGRIIVSDISTETNRVDISQLTTGHYVLVAQYVDGNVEGKIFSKINW